MSLHSNRYARLLVILLLFGRYIVALPNFVTSDEGILRGKVGRMKSEEQVVHTWSVPDECVTGLLLQYYNILGELHITVPKGKGEADLGDTFQKERHGRSTVYTLALLPHDVRVGQTISVMVRALTNSSLIGRLSCLPREATAGLGSTDSPPLSSPLRSSPLSPYPLSSPPLPSLPLPSPPQTSGGVVEAGSRAAHQAGRQLHPAGYVTLYEANMLLLGDEKVMMAYTAPEIGMYTIAVNRVCEPLMNSLIMFANTYYYQACPHCTLPIAFASEVRFCDDNFVLNMTVPVLSLTQNVWYFELIRAANVEGLPPTEIFITVTKISTTAVAPSVTPLAVLPPSNLIIDPLALAQRTTRYSGWYDTQYRQFFHFVYEPWKYPFSVDGNGNATTTGTYAIHVRALSLQARVTVGLTPAVCSRCYMRDNILTTASTTGEARFVTVTIRITADLANQPIYLQVMPVSSSTLFVISIVKISDSWASPESDGLDRIPVVLGSMLALVFLGVGAVLMWRSHLNKSPAAASTAEQCTAPTERRVAWVLPRASMTEPSVHPETITIVEVSQGPTLTTRMHHEQNLHSELPRMYRRLLRPQRNPVAAVCQTPQTTNAGGTVNAPAPSRGASGADPQSYHGREAGSLGTGMSSTMDPFPHSIAVDNDEHPRLPTSRQSPIRSPVQGGVYMHQLTSATEPFPPNTEGLYPFRSLMRRSTRAISESSSAERPHSQASASSSHHSSPDDDDDGTQGQVHGHDTDIICDDLHCCTMPNTTDDTVTISSSRVQADPMADASDVRTLL